MATTKLKAPTKLTLALAKDTGTGKTDNITNDATLKLGKIDAGTTLQWHDSSGKWVDIAPSLLTIDLKTKTALLDTKTLLGADFANKTLEFQQVNATGTASAATSIKVTYDTTAPTLTVTPSTADSLLNSKTSIIHLTSNEKLIGLDAKDFTLSDPKLATIKSVTEVKPSTPDGVWGYDVTLSAAAKGAGEEILTFAKTAAATDIAGNAIDFSSFATTKLANVWVGSDALQVSLVEDTGPTTLKTASKDGITHNDEIKLAGIKADATVEFHIKANSASLPEGSDWVSIDGLTVDGRTAITHVEDLYTLAGVSLDEMSIVGWKDMFEFRQGGEGSKATALTMTYDNEAMLGWGAPPDSDEIAKGKTVVIQYTSDEQLFGLDKNDFTIDNKALAAITGFKATPVKEDGMQYWTYDVTVKATATGEVNLSLASDASAFDAAGNQAITEMDPYTLFIV